MPSFLLSSCECMILAASTWRSVDISSSVYAIRLYEQVVVHKSVSFCCSDSESWAKIGGSTLTLANSVLSSSSTFWRCSGSIDSRSKEEEFASSAGESLVLGSVEEFILSIVVVVVVAFDAFEWANRGSRFP